MFTLTIFQARSKRGWTMLVTLNCPDGVEIAGVNCTRLTGNYSAKFIAFVGRVPQPFFYTLKASGRYRLTFVICDIITWNLASKMIDDAMPSRDGLTVIKGGKK